MRDTVRTTVPLTTVINIGCCEQVVPGQATIEVPCPPAFTLPEPSMRNTTAWREAGASRAWFRAETCCSVLVNHKL